MNARQFVAQFQNLVEQGPSLDAGRTAPVRPRIPAGAPNVLLFSPHPDDECIVGGLALRLLREARWNVVNIGVTLGSQRGRQAARRRELEKACAALGFRLIIPGAHGLERINPETRPGKSAHWRQAVKVLAGIVAEQNPRVIFLPHEQDVHPAHVGVHWLVMDALKALPKRFSCFTVETEFWGQMANPNVLVEIGGRDLATLITALSQHIGEVRRNAYHARLPAWMLDNVRRGAELVGGRGAKAPAFPFATVYRLRRWCEGRLRDIPGKGQFLSRRQNAAILFK